MNEFYMKLKIINYINDYMLNDGKKVTDIKFYKDYLIIESFSENWGIAIRGTERIKIEEIFNEFSDITISEYLSLL